MMDLSLYVDLLDAHRQLLQDAENILDPEQARIIGKSLDRSRTILRAVGVLS